MDLNMKDIRLIIKEMVMANIHFHKEVIIIYKRLL